MMVWAETFTEQPAPPHRGRKARLAGQGHRRFPWAATPSSPLATNIERARRSGVTAIVQPGGSIRDQQVIDTCKPLRYCHGLLRHPACSITKNRTCLRRFFVAGSCAVKGVQYEDSRCWRRRA